ncbi:HNH endonuclease, partial [Salmonella enterica]|nr:HNH endonuclease [Salmonella enterica]
SPPDNGAGFWKWTLLAQGVLQHRYDVQGNRTETQMPDGRTLRYLYYGSGHLQQINLGRDVISEFTRDHLHREVQRSQGRLDTRRMYDRTGRLTRKLTCKGMRGVVPETFIDREYAYSGQDELLKKRHSRQGVTDYFYDTTGRITACRNEAYLDSWQYDAAANLLDRRQGETAQAGAGSVVPFNRITSYRGLHYRYDEYGRVVEKRGRNGTQHYRWDAEHRLTEVAVIRGSTVRRYGYVYDAPGRRVEKHELDAEGKPYNRTTFLWDGMRLAQECRLGRSSSLYIYSDQGSHEPLARVDRAAPGEADEVLYYHTDVNGAPEEMTDGGGNIVWEAGYQVWGNLTHEKETRPVQQNLRFQGQYLDRETGLHYNLYRFYDPDIGKFISGDPISIRGGINLYQYAPNPISWIDPLGLAVDPIAKLEDRGYTGVTRTSGGGLDYSDSNALYNKRPGVNPVVTIEYSGDYLKDFERANTAAKLNQKSTPRGYVWHHLDDYDPVTNKGTMQLIKQGAHQGISHSGGVSQYKAATGKSYTFPARKGGRLCD